MHKFFLAVSIIFIANFCFAQKPIEIGKAMDAKYIITADTAILRKALQQLLADGTIITHIYIESEHKWHYLIGTGRQKNYTKTIAVELTYNIDTRTYFAVDGLAHKTCASAGCGVCEPFKENGNMIGCHCKEAGTVSNECNFKTEIGSKFYKQFVRQMAIKNKRH